MRSRGSGPVVLVTLVLASTGARIAGADDRPSHDQLRPQRARTLPIVGVAATLYIVGETLAKDALSPDACRWCATNGLDDGVRDALRWDRTDTAKTWSNLSGFAAAPLAALAMTTLAAAQDDRGDEWLDNGLVIAEAALLASDVNYLFKIAVGRERPDIHQLATADKAGTANPQDNNLSFFSGHSTLAMSLAVAAGTTASLRGYRHARLVWATTVPIAVATGYLRIAGDRHWASDVVTGLGFGAGVGFAVPYVFHRRRPAALTPMVARSSTATTIGVALTW